MIAGLLVTATGLFLERLWLFLKLPRNSDILVTDLNGSRERVKINQAFVDIFGLTSIFNWKCKQTNKQTVLSVSWYQEWDPKTIKCNLVLAIKRPG